MINSVSFCSVRGFIVILLLDIYLRTKVLYGPIYCYIVFDMCDSILYVYVKKILIL